MPKEIHTGGGAAIRGSVDTQGGAFIGRDQINLYFGYTQENLELALTVLRRALSTGQAEMQADLNARCLVVRAPNSPTVTLSEDAAADLLTAARQMPGERAYLTALMVHPRYARWAAQFVPLAGMLREPRRPPGWSDIPPEFSLLEMCGEGPQRQFERIRLEDITQVTAKHSELVLLGEPGAGKTTTLYRLGWQAAQTRLQTGEGKLPLFIPLAEYGAGYAAPADFVAALARSSLGSGFDLQTVLRRGEMFLLIDALNEMPFSSGADYRRRVQAWRQFAEAWPGNQMLFTCRSLDYSEPLGLPQVEIERMDDARVQDFLGKYLPKELAQTAWERLEDSPLLELVRNPYYLNMLAFIVAQNGDWPRNRARLFESFERVLWGREALRNHPHWLGEEVMRRALSELGYRFQKHGEGTRMSRSAALKALAAVAPDPEAALRLAQAASLLDTESPPEDKDEEQVRFYHHQLQEYFAARSLLSRFSDGKDLRALWKQPRLKREMPSPGNLGDWDPLPPPPPTGWEETTILAAALTDDLPAFVAAVQAVNPALAGRCLSESGVDGGESLKDAVRRALQREMRDRRVHLRYRIAAGETLGNLGDPRFARLEADGVEVIAPPFVYLPGGTFRMGSSRWEILRLGVRNLPLIRDELPRHEATLAPFWMARYPVTRAEYACFVRAGGYWETRYWRTEAARAWLRGEETGGPVDEIIRMWQALRENPVALRLLPPQQRQALEALLQMEDESEVRAVFSKPYQRERTQPAFWEDERFGNPSQPVVGVTWYEALAYCAWLEARLRTVAGRVAEERTEEAAFWQALASGRYRMMLPSEAEWEYAARGAEGRRYPWRNRWRKEAVNTVETQILRPAPTGIFPAGTTPSGIVDLCGNVWEWTRSVYRKYPCRADDGRDDLEADGRRVLRGGSWFDSRWFVRAAVRFRDFPGNFDDFIGFRVVLSPVKLGGGAAAE